VVTRRNILVIKDMRFGDNAIRGRTVGSRFLDVDHIEAAVDRFLQ